MKIGIFISGLGQSFVNETVEKYTERLKNEISCNTQGIDYEIQKEKINYTVTHESLVVSIYEKTPDRKLIYKIYDFNYQEILTEKFTGSSLIVKNLWLFLLAVRKFPLLIKRLFIPENYNRPLQTLYLFLIFIIIATAVLLMLPSTIDLIVNFLAEEKVLNIVTGFRQKFGITNIPYISKEGIEKVSKVILSLTALLLLVMPNANILIANLATEFICANDYMEYGVQRQLIQGNLELLVDYIAENEKDCKIHFHSYSFGSILAIDYIYPFGNIVSKNAERFCEAIITIGTPFEFVNSYYPEFYLNRKNELGDTIQWLNVYSIADALGTNFRNDALIGEAEFGIAKASNNKPININYEVSILNEGSITNFFMLYNIKVHGMYWDNKTEGLSCLRLIYDEMNKRNLI